MIFPVACRYRRPLAVILLLAMVADVSAGAHPSSPPNSPTSGTTLGELVIALRGKAKSLENSAGMRHGFQSFISAYKLPPESVSYSDYVMARLLFEATRDAGFWNLHWTITDREPNSDEIWRQWKVARVSSLSQPTASAECDELSALYAFLAGRAGVRGVGLLWPTYNHTVAVWVLHPVKKPVIRVVVPTSQIFLSNTDMFGTRKFDPWRQKSVHEYTRRDVADSFQLPKPLFTFFLFQVEKYAGATDATLQTIRYLREGVFRGDWPVEAAAQDALRKRADLGSGPLEDLAALQNFAQDMRTGMLR